MRAMQINGLAPLERQPVPLSEVEIPIPEPGPGEILVRVRGCGVCHTEIDEIEGRTAPPHLPVTPGHQVIGEVILEGPGCVLELSGKQVGVGWIFHACGSCKWCREGRENLCPKFRATGRDAQGGYAEYMVVDENFALEIPSSISDLHAAPLLCAGAVGFRALRLCSLAAGETLGLTGFGASGHLVLQMARALHPSSSVYIFARSEKERAFALSLGADWAGDTREAPPEAVDAMIDTTPAWLPVLAAMDVLAPGGRLVINAIRKEDKDHEVLNSLDYDRHLWREKSICTVANVTREDVRGCLELSASGAVKATAEVLPLEKANQALQKIRQGGLRGAIVLRVSG